MTKMQVQAEQSAGWGKRIGVLLEQARDLKVADYKSKFGKARSAVNEYTKEERNPDISFLIRLSEYFDVPIEWIVTGRYPKSHVVAELQSDYLEEAIETALLSAEAMKAKGKSFSTQQIAAHAKALYELRLREAVDGIVSPVKVTQTLEPSNDVPGNENGDHEVHRRSRASKR